MWSLSALPAVAMHAGSLAVLLVADLFHPVDGLAVELFLDGDVRHRRGGRCTVPMLLARREPDHVAGTDLLGRTAVALYPAATRRDDQGLAQRVGVPRGAGARLERDAGPGDARRVGRLEQRVHANRPGEIVRRSLAGRL